MKDQRSPYKDQDIAEPATQICGRQREFLKDELPADGIKAKDHNCQAEPGDIAARKKRISAAELQTGSSQTLHEDSDDRQKSDIAAFAEQIT